MDADLAGAGRQGQGTGTQARHQEPAVEFGKGNSAWATREEAYFMTTGCARGWTIRLRREDGDRSAREDGTGGRRDVLKNRWDRIDRERHGHRIRQSPEAIARLGSEGVQALRKTGARRERRVPARRIEDEGRTDLRSIQKRGQRKAAEETAGEAARGAATQGVVMHAEERSGVVEERRILR